MTWLASLDDFRNLGDPKKQREWPAIDRFAKFSLGESRRATQPLADSSRLTERSAGGLNPSHPQ
jgi:hypothetical protein